ncbi:exocyst complex component Sec3-domain-containing protein [Rhodotorula diobovata]|uniref:Exocyst complex component Sec3-domain-containing protein n=1 Tax=Rhodotorula diobovata TaxID=5288 RepID=A0A5C5FJV7_9BASI|nr:exocyst complex component Sec3-domain-containing protein [Rhodotorula diobovata]
MAQDYSRAIIHSLFSQPPGSPHPPQETFIAYVHTLEDQPGSPQRKARFLILAAQRDGRCKIHKAKQNANGTFSIGKTWALDDLQRVEVGKRLVSERMQPLEFTLIINSKTYRYDTELPSSHQAQFLVTLVRCWRRYMSSIGRSQNDLVLVGFSVDTPAQQAAAAPQQAPPPAHQQQPQRPSTGSMPPPSRPSRPPAPPAQGAAAPPPLSASSRSEYGPPPPTASSASSSSSAAAPRPSTSSSRQGSFNERDRPPISAGAPPAQRPAPPQQQQQRPPSPRARSAAAPPPPAPAAPTQPAPAAPQRRPSGIAPDARPGMPPVAPSSSSSAAAAGSASAAQGRSDIRVDVGGAPPAGSGSGSGRPGSAGGGGARPSSAGSNASRARPASPSAPMPLSAVSRRAAEEHIDDDAVLANVEEMLEGFEWRGGGGGAGAGLGLGLEGAGMGGVGGGGGKGRSKADEIEKRLVGELKALEAASIHAIMESDDRVVGVVKQLDDALAELDKMDLMIGLYKTQLNLMTEDIAHIESQNRGLQVQTSNQRALLSELDKLMSTIHIPDHDLTALTQESLESQQGIEKLERSVVSLYKALLSTRDTAVGDMAAASERVGEYRAKAQQFSKRIFDFLAIMFRFQVDQVLNPKAGADGGPARDKGRLRSHAAMEDFLGRYCGLMLFVKEIDQQRYQLICSAYFTAMSDLHRQEIQELMNSLRGQVKKATDDELEASFSVKDSPTMRQQSMRRVGTIARAPLEGGRKDKDKDGKMTGSEAFARALQQITPHLAREQGFISDFLHINPLDASITFADYMSLETFFRRGATSYLAQQAQRGQLRDIRSAMEVVFGFLEGELRDWIDGVLQKDSMQIVGILAALDRFVLRNEEDHNEFFKRVLQKQYQRSLLTLERSCKEQIRSIEQTKLTLKKRKGVVPFVRVFPLFVARVESQLDGADALNIRQVINGHYERIVASMFDCLQQMAKMDGEGQGTQGEAKDQLNYHVILIENMHHIVTVFSTQQRVAALAPFVDQARTKYDQNLAAYIRLILRRPLGRQLDWFAGLEQLLRTTPPTEVSLHGAYTRSALRRITSETRAKDLRRAIDALFKRVDKHFGAEVVNQAAQQKDVLKTVWKACEDELVRLVSVWKGLIAKCYPDDKGGGLDVGRQELHTFFSNAQLSPR